MFSKNQIYYAENYAVGTTIPHVLFDPVFDIFFPNLRILLGFIPKFKRHRLYPKVGNKTTVLYKASSSTGHPDTCAA